MILLYEILSKHGWVPDFSRNWTIFHQNHHNFVTYEPFLKKIHKKSNPNIRLESIPGACRGCSGPARPISLISPVKLHFQICPFNYGKLKLIWVVYATNLTPACTFFPNDFQCKSLQILKVTQNLQKYFCAVFNRSHLRDAWDFFHFRHGVRKRRSSTVRWVYFYQKSPIQKKKGQTQTCGEKMLGSR